MDYTRCRSLWHILLAMVLLQFTLHPPSASALVLAAPCESTLPTGGQAGLPDNIITAPGGQNVIVPAELPHAGNGGGSGCENDPEQCASTADGRPGGVWTSTESVPFVSPSISFGVRGVQTVALLLPQIDGLRVASGACTNSPPPVLPSNTNPPAAPVGAQATTPPPASSVASPPEPPTPVPCPPLPGPPPLPDARQIALGVAVPYPDVQIGVNPSPLGLTGLPSWFWIQGYDGRPLDASTTINVAPKVPAGYPGDCPPPPGATLDVTVQLTPFAYAWTFGDQLTTSAITTTSLGKGYPQASDIQHRYESTSLGHPDGFPVTVTMRLHARYQANGAAWQDLPDASRTYTRTYQVQQAQTVVVNQR